MKNLDFPCGVGDTVFCNIDNHKEDYLDECYVKRIEVDISDRETDDGIIIPLYTVICKPKAEYATFWADEFGRYIFTLEQYFNL